MEYWAEKDWLGKSKLVVRMTWNNFEGPALGEGFIGDEDIDSLIEKDLHYKKLLTSKNHKGKKQH